ncbi:MAG: HAD hydrolase-like protein [Planctomycetota bacterium]
MTASSQSTPRAAQPGWGPPPRGVFLDVLGTLVRPTEDGGFPSISDAQFYDGVLDGLFRVTQAGWNLYLVGNIDSVAFGRQTADDWRSFKTGLHDQLKGLGIRVRRDYTCTDHPEGVKGCDRDSVYLLPGTGAMHHAAQADDVSLPLCWVVGDCTTELVAGWRAGCRLAAVQTGEAARDGRFHVDPELTTDTAAQALTVIARDMTILRRSA